MTTRAVRSTDWPRAGRICGSWLLIFVCTALAADAADKPSKKAKDAEDPTSKSVAEPDKKLTVTSLDKAVRNLSAKLRQPVTFEWDDVSLPDALAKLEEATKVKFAIDEHDFKEETDGPQSQGAGEMERPPRGRCFGGVSCGLAAGLHH